MELLPPFQTELVSKGLISLLLVQGLICLCMAHLKPAIKQEEIIALTDRI